jgi:undecaprenyl pyrophosphate synthase
MKYLKRFNEAKEAKKEMTDANRRAVAKKVKAELKDNKDLLAGQKEKFQDKLITKYCKELGFKLTDFYAADGKMLNKLLESREEREGTFDYFMTKSKEELIDYQKNFQHSFENPAEHDPKFVAWKKACEVKKCFDKESFPHSRKESEFPSKMIY